MIMKKLFAAGITGIAAASCIFGAYKFDPSIVNKVISKGMVNSNHGKSEQDKKASAEVYGFVPYKVKKGDTVYGICREKVNCFPENKAAEMIMDKNKLKSNDDIKEGQIIYIPYKNVENDIEYVVKDGDTIFTIANKLMPGKDVNACVEDIIEENDLNSINDIEEGKILFIPYEK